MKENLRTGEERRETAMEEVNKDTKRWSKRIRVWEIYTGGERREGKAEQD